ncbi:unnamed protein product [Prunus brigantina]
MALSGGGNNNYKLETLEAEVEIKSNADRLYKVFSNQHHAFPNASSDHVHDVVVHEGDWETSGSIKLWTYTADGNVEIFKEKMEIDEANKWVSFTALEGHVLEQYRSYKISFQVTPKSEGGGLVKITIHYGKLNDNDPPPHKYLRFAINVVHDMDAHLLKE